jgi:hypothetical protein
MSSAQNFFWKVLPDGLKTLASNDRLEDINDDLKRKRARLTDKSL